MRIGSRGSALALAQARFVADRLQVGRLGDVEIVTVTTSGDRRARGGDKSRWVDAIEDALLAREIDVAVHSAKDLPGELAAGLTLLGGPARAAPEDALCGARRPGDPAGSGGLDGPGELGGLEGLAEGARVGTSSIRRRAQLRAAREDLDIVLLGGNVDTRLRKLARGDFDAIVLARAGLQRLAREDAIGAVLDPARFVPAPGQGMLALEARADDAATREAAAAILDSDATACLLAERALARALDASCHTPLGAHAAPAGCDCLLLRAWIGLPDGSAWVADELLGGFYDPESLGARVAERMRAAGAAELLARAQEMAVAGA
ncbi:MAG TPA: hydroxymethylbilane synthase [Solirubrobacteraceae bacterium]|nr:hydroxymethylbilane synthase [Solirubrobacteraceae bacterium]